MHGNNRLQHCPSFVLQDFPQVTPATQKIDPESVVGSGHAGVPFRWDTCKGALGHIGGQGCGDFARCSQQVMICLVRNGKDKFIRSVENEETSRSGLYRSRDDPTLQSSHGLAPIVLHRRR